MFTEETVDKGNMGQNIRDKLPIFFLGEIEL